MDPVMIRLKGEAGDFRGEGCWGGREDREREREMLRCGCERRGWRGLNGGRRLAETRKKKGCSSEKCPLTQPQNKTGPCRTSKFPTMKTVPPAECSVCVCVSVSAPSVSLTHTGWNGFFLPTAYQVSPGSSVVAAAIHTGWIALMKTVSSWSPPVALELSRPVNTGRFKESRRCWCDLLACRFSRWAIHCQKNSHVFFFIFTSAGAFCQREVFPLWSRLWSFPHGQLPLNTKIAGPGGGSWNFVCAVTQRCCS